MPTKETLIELLQNADMQALEQFVYYHEHKDIKYMSAVREIEEVLTKCQSKGNDNGKL